MSWTVLVGAALLLQEASQVERLFQEVYGEKLAAAKTPQAKTALAKELLDLAKKETDTEAKRMELQTAKRLAIEAEAPGLALDIVRAWVDAFPETSLNQSELLERAELLWKEAEAKRGIEKLAWRTDAVEMWFQSKTTSGLVHQKWLYRIGLVAGTIVLQAKDARLTGPVNYVRHVDSIGDWTDPSAFVEWDTWLEQGTWTIEVTYALGYDKPSALVGISLLASDGKILGKPITFVVRPTGPGFVFRSERVGLVRIARSGIVTIRLHVVQKFPHAIHVIQLRNITLVSHSAQ